MIDMEPPSFDELQARYGPPVGVEDARAHWGTLVRAAKDGTTTLITRERWELAALVPLSRVSGVLSGLPVLSLSTARAKLGDLVRQAAQPYDEGPVLLTRHRSPVAALVSARRLLGRPATRRRPPAETLLAEGHAIALAGGPLGGVVAIARDRDGEVVATGLGETVAEALRSLED
ncbi:type II toxin-antitoxin system prevent-host-death family antitoxin [Nonomuraea terrae]|uniref:Type II toxin-antitoxin system prevent-host-death family antitoxin n=1 Tax=Nonomuraea terrae TaxID=2530383 RepID=A0A4R4XT33_9ACTN|nr:type II toxin-antitoxin system prevent-host-death family antitoxin [Nonomuraea terrae]TDD34718.1 type II toxin-antitoxin system prevent-host-death family antitoxin [Nonomuraea terrae]